MGTRAHFCKYVSTAFFSEPCTEMYIHWILLGDVLLSQPGVVGFFRVGSMSAQRGFVRRTRGFSRESSREFSRDIYWSGARLHRCRFQQAWGKVDLGLDM